MITGLECLRRALGRPLCSRPVLEGAYKQEGDGHFTQSDSNRTWGNGFKLKEGRFRLDVRKKFFTQCDEAREQVAWRDCGCPISEGIQGQDEWDPGSLI